VGIRGFGPEILYTFESLGGDTDDAFVMTLSGSCQHRKTY